MNNRKSIEDLRSKMPEDFFPKNKVEEVRRSIAFKLMKDLLLKVRGNPEMRDLSEKLEKKATELYGSIKKDKADSPSTTLCVIPKDTQMDTVYVEEAKKMCDTLGLNLVVNPLPDYQVKPSDYIVLTRVPHPEWSSTAVSLGFGGNFYTGPMINPSYKLLENSAGGLVLNGNLSEMTKNEVFLFGNHLLRIDQKKSFGHTDVYSAHDPLSLSVFTTRSDLLFVSDAPPKENNTIFSEIEKTKEKALEALNKMREKVENNPSVINRTIYAVYPDRP